MRKKYCMIFDFTHVTTAPRHLVFSGAKKTQKFELCRPMTKYSFTTCMRGCVEITSTFRYEYILHTDTIPLHTPQTRCVCIQIKVTNTYHVFDTY